MRTSDNYGFTDAAVAVLEERYLHEKEDGTKETIPEMFHRVAINVANGNEAKAERYYHMMLHRDFLPNSPTLMNAGRKGKAAQLSACYVLPIEDSMAGIFEALKNMALVHKSGGGTGFDFSKLRPKGAQVGSTKGLASGPVSFMRLFDLATETVMQGGARRGANMGILRVDHPDILDFIKCKRDGGFTNFNISVAVTDAFMDKVRSDTLDPKEKEIWDAIVENAWATGDPGLIFIDEINRHNYAPELGPIESTNPCGESPLHAFEACNLGSINLTNFLTEYKTIAWDDLGRTVKDAVDFLNDVIAVNVFPLKQIAERVAQTCVIGLGVMGWADLLFKMGIPYGSKPSLIWADRIMTFIRSEAVRASDGRNRAVTCIAPTGTISLIAGCSSGIEPIFALEYDRVAFDKDEDADGNSKRRILHFKHPEYQAALYDPYDPRIEEGVFVTAHDIHWSKHIEMQATFQKSTDLAVSKTINLSRHATKRDVASAYILAWQKGCKGVTIFRDGCKDTQVLYKSADDGSQSERCPECGSADVIHESGCKRCSQCGWSPCSI